MSQGPSAYDRTVSLHGERLLVPLWHHVDALSDVIAKDGALALILIDAKLQDIITGKNETRLLSPAMRSPDGVHTLVAGIWPRVIGCYSGFLQLPDHDKGQAGYRRNENKCKGQNAQ